jgi:diguanylate cyclase (GGDEF)-like protein
MGVNSTDPWQSCSDDISAAECNVQLRRRVAELEQEVVRVRHLAYHDSLTGLPNRELLLDRLDQAMSQAARQHKAVGLLLLDLNDFKRVNDDFGHSAGDVILQRVAVRLSKCIRGCDTACRYGGDEFVILLPEIDDVDDVRSVVRKIHALLAKPHRLGHQILVIGASIGAALYSGGLANCKNLIDAADAAMYRSKRRGDSELIIAGETNGEYVGAYPARRT